MNVEEKNMINSIKMKLLKIVDDKVTDIMKGKENVVLVNDTLQKIAVVLNTYNSINYES